MSNKTPEAAVDTNSPEYVDETIRQLEEVGNKTEDGRTDKCPAPTLLSSLPLTIQRIKKNNETGGIDFTLSLTYEQVYVLLNFAIIFLSSQGLAQFADVEAAQATEQKKQETITLGEQLH